MSFPVLPATVPYLKEDGSNWSTFATRFREAMLATHRWGYFDGTTACPVPRDAAHPTIAERQATKEWQRENGAARGLLSPRLADVTLLRICAHKTAKGRWDRLIEEFGQPDDPNANTPKGVAHPEPDLMLGEEADLNASAHLEGAEPEPLMDGEEDQSLDVDEDGAARKAASVEGDVSPRVELQDPGVSCLATQEVAGSLTISSSSPPPPTTLEAASTQRSLAVDTETPAIPVPEHGADLKRQPHDTPPPPNEAAEHPIYQPPEQIRAPTEVEGPLESLPGEESQRAMGHRGLTLARTHEGETPIREAHGRPPDFVNPQMQGSTAWEPASTVPKAQVHMHQVRGPVPDEGAHTRPDPWPSAGVIIVDPDTCIGSASQLEGEQNIHSPSVGGELHAAPPAPQNFPSSFSPSPFPPFDTLVRENPSRGEGIATKRRAIDDRPHPKPSKLPDTHGEGLQEAGGVPSVLGNSPAFPENPDPFGLPGADKKADVQGVEPSRIDAYERGGAPLLVGVAPALAEETAGVGPAGEAEKAVAAKPEALVPWAQYKAGRRCEVDGPPPEALPQKSERNPEALSREPEPKRRPKQGERKPVWLPREAPQGDEGALEVPPQNHEREHAATPQGNPNEGALVTWDPGGGPAGERIAESKGPVEAKDIAPGIEPHMKNDAVGIVARQHSASTRNLAAWRTSQTAAHSTTNHHAPVPHPLSWALVVKKPIRFRFEAHREGVASFWAMQRQQRCNKAS